MNNNEIAVILAAGLGTRLLPITKKTPKPLVAVNDIPIIETIISALIIRRVHMIYIVVGYKKNDFEYLTVKYKNVKLIENLEYMTKENISSIKAVENLLGNNNCFICEGDLLIQDENILLQNFNLSGYFGKFEKGCTNEWVFVTKDNKIKEIKIGGENLYIMVGISYWQQNDIQKVIKAVSKAYMDTRHVKLYWDEIVNELLNEIKLTVYPLNADQVIEIDTVEELNVIKGRYKEHV